MIVFLIAIAILLELYIAVRLDRLVRGLVAVYTSMRELLEVEGQD